MKFSPWGRCGTLIDWQGPSRTGHDGESRAYVVRYAAEDILNWHTQIDQAVVTEGTKRGLRPAAILDITSRARTNFKLVNGVPQAFEGDGQTVRMGRDGVSLMTLAEWVDALVSDAPHLFEANAGGGAVGSGSRGAGTGVANPFRMESWNVTEQMKLQKMTRRWRPV